MSPCDEYKKLVMEWKAARADENYWRHGAPEPAKEHAEKFRKQADTLKTAMEEHVKVCGVCKSS